MAQLSNCFCSPYQFLTLCRLLVAPAAKCGTPTSRDLTQGCLQCHNPLITFVYQLICPVINYQTKANKVWALPRSLATTSGIIGYFLFLGVLRCFSSPAYRSPILYIQIGATRHNPSWVSPFGHLRIKA